MALTRALLKSLGLDDDKINTIIEAHSETVDGLKTKISEAESERDKAKNALKAGNEWEAKYNNLNAEFETYKNDQAAKETRRTKETAYKALLNKMGVSSKVIDDVMRISDIDAFEMDEKGKFKDETGVSKSIREKFGNFITTTRVSGANVSKPPANGGNTGMSRDDIMKIPDRAERLAAIKANPQAFRTNQK